MPQELQQYYMRYLSCWTVKGLMSFGLVHFTKYVKIRVKQKLGAMVLPWSKIIVIIFSKSEQADFFFLEKSRSTLFYELVCIK